MTHRRVEPGPGATAAGLLVVLLVVHLAGRGNLATPGLTDPGAWPAWLDRREPVEVAFSILRLIALGLAWYLLIALAVGVVLRARGATQLVAAVDLITPAMLRRVMAGVVVLGLAGPAAAQAANPSPTTTTSTTTTTTAQSAAEPVTMHRLFDGETPPSSIIPPAVVSPPSVVVPPPAAAPSPDPVPTPDSSSAAVPNSWTVRSGECFWTIADDVLTAAWGRPPSDAEVVPYWRRLIEANRHLLADPANPDLIFPGQVLTVPLP